MSPPSTSNEAPVMKLESEDAKNAIAPATSSGVPRRLSGAADPAPRAASSGFA